MPSLISSLISSLVRGCVASPPPPLRCRRRDAMVAGLALVGSLAGSGCSREAVCVDMVPNATLAGVGWNESTAQATIAIDRAIGFCEGEGEDEPSHERDILELSPAEATWRFNGRVAMADELGDYQPPTGFDELFGGPLECGGSGCQLVLHTPGGEGTLDFTVPGPDGLIGLTVTWQDEPALVCNVDGSMASCRVP